MSNKMLMSKVADPYASALLNLASSTNTLDTITSDINDLLELFDSNENLVGYLRNPMYSKSSKKEVLEKVIAPLYFNENTVRFLMVLLDRSRIDLLESIPTISKIHHCFQVRVKMARARLSPTRVHQGQSVVPKSYHSIRTLRQR